MFAFSRTSRPSRKEIETTIATLDRRVSKQEVGTTFNQPSAQGVLQAWNLATSPAGLGGGKGLISQ